MVTTLAPSWVAFEAAPQATLPNPLMAIPFAGNVDALGSQHLFYEIETSVTGSLGADKRAAEFETLAGERAGVFVGEFLVHAEHVAHLGGRLRLCRRPVRRCRAPGGATTPT